MSGSLRISYIDENFSVSQAISSQLILQLAEHDSYQMAICFPPQCARIMLSWDGHEQEVRTKHLLNLSFLSKRVGLTPDACTLVPTELLDTERLDDFYPVLGLHPETHRLLCDKIDDGNISVVYGLEKRLLDEVLKRFPDASVVASASAFLQAALAVGINEENTLYINFRPAHTDLLHIKDGHPQFFSIFPKHDVDEYTYFLLSCAKELGLDLAETKMVLSGNISANDSFHERCIKYGSKVFFADPNDFLYAALPDTLTNTHRYFGFLGLTLCG